MILKSENEWSHESEMLAEKGVELCRESLNNDFDGSPKIALLKLQGILAKIAEKHRQHLRRID